MRVATALFDADGRCCAASDLVAWDGGRRQETALGHVEPDGGVRGTHWRTDLDQHSPRPITEAEGRALRDLADALRSRGTGSPELTP